MGWNGLEYDFVVDPGGDVADIAWEVSKTYKPRLLDGGQLVIEGDHTHIIWDAPFSF